MRHITNTMKWILIALVALVMALSPFIYFLPKVIALKYQNPAYTHFMLLHADKMRAQGLDPTIVIEWVNLSDISSHLQRAVLVAEDDTFYEHEGFNWDAFRLALRKNWKEKAFKRGGSTISQQLAKNMYLSPEKSLFRKLKEAIITFQMEHVLSKKRILELYLNLVEWGPGVFGAEAAAVHYFDKHADNLNREEAAYLAALLPNPKKFSLPGYQGYVKKRARQIAARMR